MRDKWNGGWRRSITRSVMHINQYSGVCLKVAETHTIVHAHTHTHTANFGLLITPVTEGPASLIITLTRIISFITSVMTYCHSDRLCTIKHTQRRPHGCEFSYPNAQTDRYVRALITQKTQTPTQEKGSKSLHFLSWARSGG